MKLSIYDTQKKKAGDKSMPAQFNEGYRPDLIKRAVHAVQSLARQVYGTSPEAGFRHSSSLSKRRRKYRGCYGFGISRVNRKILSRRGTRFMWVGAFSAQTRGGRRAHPPKADKDFSLKINKKENQKAIRSAIAASLNREVVAERGHLIPTEYPFIISTSFEDLGKTSDVKKALSTLGFDDEMERSSQKKVRAGKGTMRGRRYKKKKGVLFVVSKECPLVKSAHNIPGVDVAVVSALNAYVLAPGTKPGRVALWTEKAVDTVTENNLFA